MGLPVVFIVCSLVFVFLAGSYFESKDFSSGVIVLLMGLLLAVFSTVAFVEYGNGVPLNSAYKVSDTRLETGRTYKVIGSADLITDDKDTLAVRFGNLPEEFFIAEVDGLLEIRPR